METAPQLVEDIGIYIILVVMLINMFFMLRWMGNQSKSTDKIYKFIEQLYTKSNEEINKEEDK